MSPLRFIGLPLRTGRDPSPRSCLSMILAARGKSGRVPKLGRGEREVRAEVGERTSSLPLSPEPGGKGFQFSRLRSFGWRRNRGVAESWSRGRYRVRILRFSNDLLAPRRNRKNTRCPTMSKEPPRIRVDPSSFGVSGGPRSRKRRFSSRVRLYYGTRHLTE